MNGLPVYVKEGLPFAWDLSLESSQDSYLCFQLVLLHLVSLLLFPLLIIFFVHNFLMLFYLTYMNSLIQPIC